MSNSETEKIPIEEMEKAKQYLTEDQKRDSEIREDALEVVRELHDKFGLDVDLQQEVFHIPDGGYLIKTHGKVNNHNIEIYGNGDIIVIDGTRMTPLEFKRSAQLINYDRSNDPLVNRPFRDSVLRDSGIDPNVTDFTIVHDLNVVLNDAATEIRHHGSIRSSEDEKRNLEIMFRNQMENAGKLPETEEELLQAIHTMEEYYRLLKEHSFLKERKSYGSKKN